MKMQDEQPKMPTDQELARSAIKFKHYLEYVDPLSYTFSNYTEPTHWIRYGWADNFQYNKKTGTLAPRGHLKSTIMHAFLRWKCFRAVHRSEKWLYVSFKQSMAAMHVADIKREMQNNPVYKDLKWLSDAESIVKCTWDGKHIFEITPAGITTFTRGWHGDGVIADDILSDPDNQLKPTVIMKITRIFFDDVWFLPNPGGYLHTIGTPQHKRDLFFELRKRDDVEWNRYPAIMDRKKQLTLWPEQYSWEDLRKEERNRPTSFRKERMCEPVWEVSQFIPEESLLKCVDEQIRNLNVGEEHGITREVVVSGMDLGKKSHPSHLIIFKYNPETKQLVQIHEKWFERTDYYKQINYLNQACEHFKVDLGYYDNTRGEFEGFAEQGKIHRSQKPMNMTTKSQGAMASSLENWVGNTKLRLVNNPRTINQILAVNGELDALETEEGHGDSFWSVAMACMAYDDLQRKKGKVRTG